MFPQKLILVGLVVFGIGVGRGAWIIEQPQTVINNTIPVVAATLESQNTPAVRLMLYASPVWIVAPGATQKVEATNGQEIAVGSKVITGENTRAAIVYPNGATTVLDFNSEAVLKDFQLSPQKVLVSLEKNRIWSRVVKLLGEESYKTESSTVVATVRGTSYGHTILANGKNKIITKEGLVLGNCKEKKQNVEIPKGYASQLDCATDKSVKPNVIQNRDKDEWYAFNEEEDNIESLLKDKESFDKVAAGDQVTIPNPTASPEAQSDPGQRSSTNSTHGYPTPKPTSVAGAIVLAPTATRTPTPVHTPILLPPGEVYIDEVNGVIGTFGACCGEMSSDTGVAQGFVTGAPDAPPSQNFIQLSVNSVIMLKFANNRVIDQPGADIRIYTVDDLYPVSSKIEVGAGPDCQSTDYREVGSYSDVNDIDIDISGTGLIRVSCVRITGLASDNGLFQNLGFDLDTAEALHSEEVL